MKREFSLTVQYNIMRGTNCLLSEATYIKDLTFAEVAAIIAALPKETPAERESSK